MEEDNSNHEVIPSPLDAPYEADMAWPSKALSDADNNEAVALQSKPFIVRDNGTKRQRRISSSNSVDEPKSVGGRGQGWKDAWVVHLVHARGELNEEFMKPPRQGVDLWSKVYSKVLGACPKFDKNAESCRKKWQMIYKLYKEDKASERVSSATGDLNPKKCNWFHLIDEYMNNSTHTPSISIVSQDCGIASLDANGVSLDENGITLDGNGVNVDGNGVTLDGNGVVPEATESVSDVNTDAAFAQAFNANGARVNTNASTPKKSKESRMDAKVDEFLTTISTQVDKMVENSTQLVLKFDHHEREKVALLSTLNETLKSFMDFLKE